MPHIKPDIESFARIKVVGVGGSGTNTVDHMIRSKVRGVEFIAVNTDAQDLHNALAKRKVFIGKNITKGQYAIVAKGEGDSYDEQRILINVDPTIYFNTSVKKQYFKGERIIFSGILTYFDKSPVKNNSVQIVISSEDVLFNKTIKSNIDGIFKDSYDFDTKRKYHEQLEQFIRRFYDARLRKKRFREAIRVACFPGHEGLEVLHVYDKLGLPRENIVGLERDPDIAQQIEDLKLGIQVENKTDAGFFEETPDKFDIVNLDYQGIVAEDSIYAIQLLAGRPIFNDKAILGTNFLGKRETDGGNKYKSFSLSPELVYRQRRALEAALRGSGELIDLEIEAARLKERAVGQKTIRQLRSDSITIGIIYALLEGK